MTSIQPNDRIEGFGTYRTHREYAAAIRRLEEQVAERDERIKDLQEIEDVKAASVERRFAEFRKHAWDQQEALRTRIAELEEDKIPMSTSSTPDISEGARRAVEQVIGTATPGDRLTVNLLMEALMPYLVTPSAPTSTSKPNERSI